MLWTSEESLQTKSVRTRAWADIASVHSTQEGCSRQRVWHVPKRGNGSGNVLTGVGAEPANEGVPGWPEGWPVLAGPLP